MLDQRLRRWPNIITTLAECMVFVERLTFLLAPSRRRL